MVAIRTLTRDPGPLLGLVVLVALIVGTLSATWLAPYDPLAASDTHALAPPSAQHLFGTDDAQRDVFSRVLWLAEYRVRVNAVAPGPIETGMTAQRFADASYREQMQRGVLVGRLGVPRDIAEAVVFLASDEALFINGAVIAVDGGLSASR